MKYRGTIASDYSGKLGGVVASRNTYGSYFRRLVKPAQPSTPGQQAQRIAFASVSQRWRTLQPGQQQLWINSAPQAVIVSKTGNPVIPTGQAYWMWCNVLRQRLGLDLVFTPPLTTELPAIHGLGVSVNGATVTVAFDSDDEWDAPGGGMLLSISPPIQPGVRFMEQYTPLGQILGTDADQPGTFPLPFAVVPGALYKLRASASTPDGRRSKVTYAWSGSQTSSNPILSVDTAGTVTVQYPLAKDLLVQIAILGGGGSLTATGSASDTTLTGTWDIPPSVDDTWSVQAEQPVDGGIPIGQTGLITAP